jgi:hypothetical protein
VGSKLSSEKPADPEVMAHLGNEGSWQAGKIIILTKFNITL